LPGDQNCLGADDLTDLADHFDQHLLDVRDDYLLQTVEPDDRCARRLIVEAHDLMKIQSRRVAWHLDAIAKNAQLCSQRADAT
jgi:hypothetical protein